tara:strand:+ start:1196 stop:2485 length:1290 start_codon:yes stop_codon:yes gene_type:complete
MIDFNKYNSKKVGILGLGITGESIFKSIKDSNAEIYLWDDDISLREKYFNNKEKLTKLEEWPWDNLDYFFPSPGVDLKNKIFLNKLNKNKTKLMSDISLFEAERGNTFPSGTMIAITGTNGKSSTATILCDILKKEGYDTRLAGNIGIPILSLEPGNEKTIYIIEVSSFQIELTENIKPEIAVLLNISEDHLDRHSSIEEYREIKSRIFLNQTRDDFSIIYNNNEHTDFISKKNFLSKKIILSNSGNLDEKKYYSKNLTSIKEVLKILEISDFIPSNYFENFKGLNHRLELVCESNGVKFINDSKATNPSATNMAFDLNQNIFWIGGGESKGNDLSKINLLSKNLERVFLVGSSSEELFNLTPKLKNPLIFQNLDSAVRAAYSEAKKSGGGNILLSPGCSSHDQFKSFEERGDIFSDIALSLIGLEKGC